MNPWEPERAAKAREARRSGECYKIGKLEDRFSKLWKAGKAIFPKIGMSKKFEADK